MTASGRELRGRSLHPGTARAPLLLLKEPLSFWGGVDEEGTVIDRHHPQVGASLTGQVLAMPSGRGSSSSTAVLAELIRSGHGPSGIVLAECDTILVLGALVAAEMYGALLPVVELDPHTFADLSDGSMVEVVAQPAPLEATIRLEGA
jgi:predicted aconitase with swiveling domain